MTGRSALAVAGPEVRQIVPSLEKELAEFLLTLARAGDEPWFHPHPLTAEAARSISRYAGSDFYCVLRDHDGVVGYGMLRGWDEGYAIPSLGIAIHPEKRGKGYGLALMHFLHSAARLRGATSVRLSVDESNDRARRLYERLGYVFNERNGRQLIGRIELT